MRPPLSVAGFRGRQLARLHELYRTTQCPRTCLRIQMILLSRQGYSVNEIGGITHQSDDTVRRWLHRFMREGCAGVQESPRSGRPSEIAPAVEQLLRECVRQTPREFGLRRPSWTAALLATVVWQRFKVKVTDECIRQQDMEIVKNRLTVLAILVTLLCAVFLPLVTGNVYLLTVLIIMLIFIIFSSAWNFLTYTGQGSLGHAAFFGIGGYISTLIAVKSGLSPYLTIFFGGAAAALVGLFIGVICVRLKGMVPCHGHVRVCNHCPDHSVSILTTVTGGWDGIASPRPVSPDVPGYQLIEYYSILLITIASVVFSWYIERGDNEREWQT